MSVKDKEFVEEADFDETMNCRQHLGACAQRLEQAKRDLKAAQIIADKQDQLLGLKYKINFETDVIKGDRSIARNENKPKKSDKVVPIGEGAKESKQETADNAGNP